MAVHTSRKKSCACGATERPKPKYEVGDYVTKQAEIKEGHKYIIKEVKYKFKNFDNIVFDTPAIEFKTVYELEYIPKPAKPYTKGLTYYDSTNNQIFATDVTGALVCVDSNYIEDCYVDEDELVEWTDMNEVLYNEGN